MAAAWVAADHMGRAHRVIMSQLATRPPIEITIRGIITTIIIVDATIITTQTYMWDAAGRLAAVAWVS